MGLCIAIMLDLFQHLTRKFKSSYTTLKQIQGNIKNFQISKKTSKKIP